MAPILFVKPGQKITRVRGNQAGISCLVGTLFLLPTSLFPFFSYHSEKRIEKHLPPTQTNHSFVGGGWQFHWLGFNTRCWQLLLNRTKSMRHLKWCMRNVIG